METILAAFVAELRAIGLPVSLSENVDAAAALRAVPLTDRALVKSALATTLVKNHDHDGAFELAFEIFFGGFHAASTSGRGRSGWTGTRTTASRWRRSGIAGASRSGAGPASSSRATGGTITMRRAWVLTAIRQRARHLYWLNPEPAAAWDTGDSIMREHAPGCDLVAQCRNLRRLAAFVEQLD